MAKTILTAIFVAFIGVIAFVTFSLATNKNPVIFLRSFAQKTDYTGFLVKTQPDRCQKTTGKICFSLLQPNGKRIIYLATGKPNNKNIKDYLGQYVKVVGETYTQDKSTYLVASNIKPVALPKGNPEGLKKVVIGIAGYTPANNANSNDAGFAIKGTSGLWSKAEPVKGELNFNNPSYTELDSIVRDCNTHGALCTILMGTSPKWAVTKANETLKAHYKPRWEGDHPDNPWVDPNYYCPTVPLNMDPETLDHYRNFVTQLVKRWNGTNGLTAHIFTPYNEPDYHDLNCGQSPWNTTLDLNQNGKPDYEDFALIQKITYEAAKSAEANHPNVEVNYGNLGNFDIHDDHRYSDIGGETQTFFYKVISTLKTVYPGPSFPYFDSVNLHFYEVYHCKLPFQENDDYSVGGVRGSIAWVKGVLEKFGTDKPVMLGEISDAVPFEANTLPESAMAVNVIKAVSQSLSVASYTKWYDLGLGDPQYGLVDPTNRRRPAFTAYHTLFTQLKGYGYDSIEPSNPDNLEGYIFRPMEDGAKALAEKGTTYKEVLWSINRDTICKLEYPACTSPDQGCLKVEGSKWVRGKCPNPNPPKDVSPYKDCIMPVANNWAYLRGPVRTGSTTPSVVKKFVATSIDVTDYLGNSQTIADGSALDGDRRKDGKVTISVTSNPIIATVRN